MHVHHMQHTFFKKRKKEKMRLDVKNTGLISECTFLGRYECTLHNMNNVPKVLYIYIYIKT